MAASCSRRSGWPTQRSSPVSPSSPKQARGASRERHAAARAGDRQRDREVAARARRRARRRRRSRTRRAPPVRTRPWRAEDREHQREAVAVEARDDPARLLELRRATTSAWTSTSSGREPSIAASTTLPGARVASATNRAEASSTSTSPPWRISNSAGLVGRAEAVLQRAQLAVGALALALELQHAVDEVLEHARARERAVLGDVADEDHGDRLRLGQLHDPRRRPRAPGRPSPGAPESSRERERLHGVDHARRRGARRRASSSTASRSVSASTGTVAARRRRREPLGAQPDLPADSSPLTYRVRAPARCRWPSTMLVSVDLPIPGEPPSSTSEPGHEASAEDPVELADPGRHAPRRLAPASAAAPQRRPADCGAGAGPPGAAAAAARRRRRRRAPRRACSRPAAGALAVPLGRTCPHSEQTEDGLRAHRAASRRLRARRVTAEPGAPG